jgi:hypothetical protein
MAEAQYSFLGWMRRGIVGMADTGSLDPTRRLSLNLELEVISEGDKEQVQTTTVQRRATLYGPGDVTGVSESAIVRTVPRQHVADFESNFLAAIEFYDEDFPWRYSPSVAKAGQLKPWVWLVVLAEGEYTRAGMMGTLPVIEISPTALQSAFPHPDTTWAWAHVQLNSGLAVQPSNVTEARVTVRRLLDENPNLGCSRLICPRHLAPQSHYTAFLVPAFEKGRRAGLGQPDRDIEEVPNVQPAWPKADAVNGPVHFPVYYQWEFSTSSAGDFETLARLLGPVRSASLSADRLIDIQEPGWGVRYRSERPNRGQPGAIALESALRIPEHTSELAFGTDPSDERFAQNLRALVNLGAEPFASEGEPTGRNPFFGSNLDDDPIVVPPLYGSFFRENRGLVNELGATWYEQLNLNPVYRVAAGQGAEVVRQSQEEYVDRAWDQLRQQMEARRVAQRWQVSLHATQRFFTKRLEPSLAITLDAGTPDSAERARREALMFRAVNVTVPMHAALNVETSSFAASIRGRQYSGAYTAAFAKATRSDGPLMRRLEVRDRLAPTDTFLNRRIHRPPSTTPLQNAVSTAMRVLEISFLRTPPPPLLPDTMFDTMLQQWGLAGLTACRTAFDVFRTRLQPPTEGGEIIAPANNLLYMSLHEQLRPAKTIPARFRAVLGAAVFSSPSEPNTERIELPALSVEFPEPMYHLLAMRSPHYIFPALNDMPPNRVTMLQPNAAFIDAYLLGLNHEMAREFRWRELPIQFDATFFRQFWDVRDNPKARARPENFKDILPVHEWANGKLGAPVHRPPGMAGNLTVVVIRGDLFRKYPYTEVFMQKAMWASEPGTQRSIRQIDTSTPENIRMPLFSARIAPEYTLVGFQLDAEEAKGHPNPMPPSPGWYFVVKERAGDVHFGLDSDPSANDPSWSALSSVPVHQCIHVESAEFRSLPRFGATANLIAAMLYQRPFVLYVHAARLL